MTYDQFVELINLPQVLALIFVVVFAFSLAIAVIVSMIRSKL